MDAKVMIQELAKALATQNSIDKKVAQNFVQTFFQVIIRALKQDKYVKIKGLGTFKQIEVESRESMNIHTGERFEIQGHMKISFTPDAALKEAVNKPFAHFETVALNDEVTDSELEAVDQEFEEQEEAALAAEVAEEKAFEETPEDISLEPMVETAADSLKETSVEQKKKLPLEEPTQEAPLEPTVEIFTKPAENISAETVEEIPVGKEEKTEERFSKEKTVPLSTAVADPVVESIAKEEEYYDDEEEEEYARKRKKYYAIFTAILVIAALAAGYGIGYLLESSKKPTEVQVLVYDTVYVEKKAPSDSLQPDEPIIQKDETTPPLNVSAKTAEKTLAAKQNTASSTAKSTVQKTATVVTKPSVTTKPAVKPATTSSSTVSKIPVAKTTVAKSVSDNHSKYPQLSGGAYWIIGTAQTYKLSKGETIRIIAERFFGSRQMELYIEKYNNISDPDHVAEGTVLNIPKLQKK